MKWILGIIALIIFILLILFIVAKIRKKQKRNAREKVCQIDDATKLSTLNALLEPYGFAYNMQKDIFYSTRNPWQRTMGYGRLYDEFAPAGNMIFHCEPITFDYDGRQWLIEFWKGQYGITTGAEVGIYVKKEEDNFYDSVSDSEMLPMEFVLKKNGKVLFTRKNVHWWLTGFVLGEFSHKEELTMEVELVFPNNCMRNCFLDGCEKIGYTTEEVSYCGNKVTICFDKPKTKQPSRYGKIFQHHIQWINKRNCKKYCNITKCFSRTIDRLTYLRFAFPKLYQVITKITWGGSQKQIKKCKKKMCYKKNR